MFKFVITMCFGIIIGVGATLHFAQDASPKEIAERQKQTHQVEATAASAAHQAEKKGQKVYEALKSDTDETTVPHQ